MAEKQIGIRLDARANYLVELARRATGQKFKTLTDYVLWALEESFEKIVITDEREANSGQDGSYRPIHGQTLAALADVLYQGSDAQQFVALANIAPWLLVDDGEQRLLRILQHSDYFAPRRILSADRIQQHWTILAAIQDGKADIEILSEDQRPKIAFAFGLLGDAERIALFNSNRAEFNAKSEAYKKAMKGE
jgi:hypothetical protein